MTQWATQLIPAGSVIAGGLVTGGLTLWGQALVNKGTHAREREARHDAFKVRQREIERDALLALQDALNEVIRIYIAHVGTSTGMSRETHDRVLEVQMTILALSARVPGDVARAASQFNIAVNNTVRNEPLHFVESDEVADALNNAQGLAGEALMREL